MKKLLIAIGMGLMAGSLWASCTGPYCYDEKGAQINTGLNIITLSSGTFDTTTPGYVGQLVMCSGCTNGGAGTNVGGYNLCVASGSAQGAYTLASSTTLHCK